MSSVNYSYYVHVWYLAGALIQGNIQKCFELPGVWTVVRFLFAQAKKANLEIKFDVAVSV